MAWRRGARGAFGAEVEVWVGVGADALDVVRFDSTGGLAAFGFGAFVVAAAFTDAAAVAGVAAVTGVRAVADVAAFGDAAAFGTAAFGTAAFGGAGGGLTIGTWPAASAAVALRRNRGVSDGFATVSETGVDAIGALVGGVASVGGVGSFRRAMIDADSRGPTLASVAVDT